MPKVPIDYSKNCNYKFKCKNLNVLDEYNGSSTNLTQREKTHKSNCNNENSKLYNLKIYQTIRANGGWDELDMILIEKYPCACKHEAFAREPIKHDNEYDIGTAQPRRKKCIRKKIS